LNDLAHVLFHTSQTTTIVTHGTDIGFDQPLVRKLYLSFIQFSLDNI